MNSDAKPFKLAIIADPLDNQRAGVHIFTKELINALVDLGKADQLLLIREQYDPALKIEQIVVPNVRLPIGFASLRLFFIIPWILRSRGVAAVFEPAHFGPFNLPRRIKRITMIHDLTPLIFPQYHRWHSQVLQRIFLKGILKRADWIFTNSKHTSQDVKRFFPFTKHQVAHLYLGKHPSFQPTYNPERVGELGISTPYFLFVGTLEPRKNLVLLLKSFSTFCLKNTATDLVIVGQAGWKNQAFVDALANHPYRNRIKILGYVPFADLPVLYTHSTALIYPSQYEGFGLPIVEALACGTSVITAKNSSLAEIGEGAAFFFATHDAADLTAKMHQVNNFEGCRFTANQQHAARFSWESCAASFWTRIEEITG